MWMMGCEEGAHDHQFNMASDSFQGRKLRPLIPRPLVPCPNPNAPNPFSQSKPTELFALNRHLVYGAGHDPRDHQSKSSTRDGDGTNSGRQQMAVVSSRWNPTPEQLRFLEEMYRRGTRTPSADQIQHITAQLRRFGKIEGKNVFYWFQNHKARERQKRRRDNQTGLHRKDDPAAGSNIELTKNWTPTTNCSTLAEESVPISRATKAAMAESCRSGRWVQLSEGEQQMHHHRRNIIGRNDTWHMMHLPSSSGASHNLINANLTCSTDATNTIATNTITSTSAAPRLASNQTRVIKSYELNLFRGNEEDGSTGESQTLQLFPLRSYNNETISEKETEMSSAEEALNSSFNPGYQFYEFLPLKN